MKLLRRFVVWLIRGLSEHVLFIIIILGFCVGCTGMLPEDIEKSMIEDVGLRNIEHLWPKGWDISVIPFSLGMLIITAAVLFRLLSGTRFATDTTTDKAVEGLTQVSRDLLQTLRELILQGRPGNATELAANSVGPLASTVAPLAPSSGTPVIRVYGTDSDDPGEIPDDACRCYENLFEVTNEQERYSNILSYLHDAFEEQEENPDRAWAELFFTITVNDRCVGIAFISLYRPLGWCFGNYFGIENGWRKRDQSGVFLDRIVVECERVMKGPKGRGFDAKGIVFEADRYSEHDIKSALAKFDHRGSVRLTRQEHDSIRAARRIELYTGRRFGRGLPHGQNPNAGETPRATRRALALVTESNNEFEFVDYIQPAMRRPLKQRSEVELWILVYPLSGMSIDTRPGAKSEAYVEEIFDFIYEHVFRSAYQFEYAPSADGTAIPGYGDYITSVRQRVERRIDGRKMYLARREKDMLSESARDLLKRHRGKLDETLGAL